jgi:hypothetical protein
MSNNIAEFVRGKPYIQGHGDVMKPYLHFFSACSNVNVRGLIAFIGIEESTISTPP